MIISKIFKKILSVGTPSDKDVLYKNVIKKKIPTESPEQLMVMGFKNSLKNMFTYEDKNIEFSRGEVPPPVKMATKKSPAKKKTTAKKTTTKKTKSTTKTVATKKPVTKKSTATPEKTTAKKPAAKKVDASTTTKKATTKATPVKKTVTKKKTATAKKPAAKKSTTKKVTESKTKPTTTKKASTKKATAKTVTEKKTKAAPRGAKKAEKIALYAKNITKHYGEVDEDFLAIIVKNLGPSIYKRDAELVSCSDPKELDTVRKNFLMKKLGIDASQKVLDAAIQDVCEELKTTRTKYRATFYYSLAKKFKKESVLS